MANDTKEKILDSALKLYSQKGNESLIVCGEKYHLIRLLGHGKGGYDYQRLKEAGIRVPSMITVDTKTERIVKEYIEGLTVFELIRDGQSVDSYLPQVREMAKLAKEHNLNIIISLPILWYIMAYSGT